MNPTRNNRPRLISPPYPATRLTSWSIIPNETMTDVTNYWVTLREMFGRDGFKTRDEFKRDEGITPHEHRYTQRCTECGETTCIYGEIRE